MDGFSYPVDVARGVDAPDLVEAAAGPERESNEALEARVQRFQQEYLFVERQDACPRLVLPALDAAERVADVVALVDRALEDRLEQSALAAHRLRHESPLLVTRTRGQVRSPQVQVANDLAPKCGGRCTTICASRFLADFSGVYVL
jgi:hypothetical protein